MTILISMQTSLDSREFLNVFDKDNIVQRFLHDINQGMGFHIMQSSQKHPRLGNCWESSKVNHQNMRRTKEAGLYKLVEDLIYGLNFRFYNNNRELISSVQALSRWQQEKSVEESCWVKKSQWKNFSRIICKWEEIFDIILGL